ncbi:MAG: hypothetical protein IJ316_04085 [Clostridia bacterium]|nr:hypothetical protein [Clostridia bacterium]
MFKERVKTSIIVMLLLNCVFLTYQMWFKSGMLGADWPHFSFADLPFVRLFIGQEVTVSVPKENLSKPRKIVINDGGLWIPYYNTDEAFDNLDEKTSDILRSVLKGNAKRSGAISYDKWLNYLSEPSVYVEYPISVSPRMLSMVLNTSFEKFPSDISSIKDAIIIPEGDDAVRVAIRDAKTDEAMEFYIEDEKLSFPEEVLSMFAAKYPRDGYYEFAYTTLLGDTLGGSVGIDDLVLFSDNDSVYRDIKAANPLEGKKHADVLKGFSFDPNPLRHYPDQFGAESYVENYATVRIFPDGYIEYSAVDPEKGIDLGKSKDNQYEILNAAIDFAEKLWSGVSTEPLTVLVSGIETTQTGHRFTFDYYYGGREIAVSLEKNGVQPLYHAIEIVTYGNKIVSYRQYLRRYEQADSVTMQENFVSALDYFITLFENGNHTITDLYPGYFDTGENSVTLKTTWLSRVDTSDERYPKKQMP